MTSAPASPNQPELTCREALDFLMAYLDDELPTEQRRAFERHLSVCPSCVCYLNSYEATIRLCGAATPGAGGAPAPSVPEALIRAVRAARRSGA